MSEYPKFRKWGEVLYVDYAPRKTVAYYGDPSLASNRAVFAFPVNSSHAKPCSLSDAMTILHGQKRLKAAAKIAKLAGEEHFEPVGTVPVVGDKWVNPSAPVPEGLEVAAVSPDRVWAANGRFQWLTSFQSGFSRILKRPAPAASYPRWVKHKELETFYIFSDERQTNAPFVYNGGGEFFYDPVAYTSGIDSMLAAGHTEVPQSEVEAAVGRVTLGNLLKGMA